MIQLPLKPVSTNRLYSGRRYLSKEARAFQDACHRHLLVAHQGRARDVPEGPLEIHFVFGLHRDIDVTNCVKLVEDIIADFYGFNDRRVQGSSQCKVKVARGQEFIAFSLRAYEEEAFVAFQGLEMRQPPAQGEEAVS